MDLPEPLVVQDGADGTITVFVDPAIWFVAEDGSVLDLSAFDFDPSRREPATASSLRSTPIARQRARDTEAAHALVAYAFRTGTVRVVQAHTLPEVNASTRVLAKCGFRRIGEIVDPHDGPVWRWERDEPTAPPLALS